MNNANEYEALAFQGENKWKPIEIPISDLVAKRPGGLAVVMVNRPGDRDAYIPEIFEQTDKSVIWTPTDFDTCKQGTIDVQGVYTVDGDLIGKTDVHHYVIKRSLRPGSETPPDLSDWVNELIEAAGEVHQEIAEAEETLDNAVTAAQNAKTAAETAQQNAETAQDLAETAERNAEQSAENALDSENASAESALESEAWAVGKRNGVDVPSTDPTYHNNSKFWADLAEQGAEESGFAFFDVNVEDGKLYVTVTDSLAEDVSFQVNESTGMLEVLYA